MLCQTRSEHEDHCVPVGGAAAVLGHHPGAEFWGFGYFPLVCKIAGTLLGCLGLVWGPRALAGFHLCSRGPSPGAGVVVPESAGFLEGGGGTHPPEPLEALCVLVLAWLAGGDLTVWVLGWDIPPRTERLRRGLPVGRGGAVGASGGGPGGLLQAPRALHPRPDTVTSLPPEVAGGMWQLEAWTGGLASLSLVSPSALSTGFLGLLGPVLGTEMQAGLLLAWCL